MLLACQMGLRLRCNIALESPSPSLRFLPLWIKIRLKWMSICFHKTIHHRRLILNTQQKSLNLKPFFHHHHQLTKWSPSVSHLLALMLTILLNGINNIITINFYQQWSLYLLR